MWDPIHRVIHTFWLALFILVKFGILPAHPDQMLHAVRLILAIHHRAPLQVVIVDEHIIALPWEGMLAYWSLVPLLKVKT